MIRKPSAGNGSGPEWFKSSYSSSSEGDSCVEVAATSSCGTVHVRDSKNLQGPQLGFTADAWSGFIAYASAT
ncbi:DUF397 domain-containing protein [Streptomyces amakusaensis]|uniref:DUF397 domain-containing protein n=1 Tax=Streptomyces amakusaensis TaxID=67271 RepID=A0ABW0AJU5_9ACTN